MAAQPEEINSHVKAFALLETAEAISNLEEILNVKGLDGVFVGTTSFLFKLPNK